MFTVIAEIGNKCLLVEDGSGQNAKSLIITKRSEIQMCVPGGGGHRDTEIRHARLYMEKSKLPGLMAHTCIPSTGKAVIRELL